MIQPTLINSNPNEYSEEFHYYPFAVKLDRCVGSLMEENVTHINGGITINIDVSVNVMYVKKSSMCHKVKDIDLKNQAYYFFNDIINIKNFDRNLIRRCFYLLRWICNNKIFEICKN